MSIKLSYTALQKYLECPYQYFLYYKDNLRQVKIGSALLFGSAIDAAISDLVINKNLEKAEGIFHTAFGTIKDVHGVEHSSTSYSDLLYSKNDADPELLTKDDLKIVDEGIPLPWMSLMKKGEIILSSFNENILPKIKRVIAVQDEIELKNKDGDVVTGKCDFVVEWEDGRILAVDLKTSGMLYDKESVKKSMQLAIYYAALKEKYSLDACAYWVCLKNINKNKTKRCSKCSFDGTGTGFKTCNNMTGTKRCGEEWDVSISPTAYIQTIVDNVDPIYVNLVLDNLDDVNHAIKNKVFYRNTNSCERPYGRCAYYGKCHENSEEGLVRKIKAPI